MLHASELLETPIVDDKWGWEGMRMQQAPLFFWNSHFFWFWFNPFGSLCRPCGWGLGGLKHIAQLNSEEYIVLDWILVTTACSCRPYWSNLVGYILKFFSFFFDWGFYAACLRAPRDSYCGRQVGLEREGDAASSPLSLKFSHFFGSGLILLGACVGLMAGA